MTRVYALAEESTHHHHFLMLPSPASSSRPPLNEVTNRDKTADEIDRKFPQQLLSPFSDGCHRGKKRRLEPDGLEGEVSSPRLSDTTALNHPRSGETLPAKTSAYSRSACLSVHQALTNLSRSSHCGVARRIRRWYQSSATTQLFG